MGKLSKALGLDMEEADSEPSDMPDEGSDEMMGEETKEKGSPSAEVLAMKMFEKAGTPEAKAEALKGFLEACGLY